MKPIRIKMRRASIHVSLVALLLTYNNCSAFKATSGLDSASGSAYSLDKDGRQIYTCRAGTVPKTPLVKLTNREYIAALKTLLDEFSPTLKNDTLLNQVLTNLPADVFTQDRDTFKEQAQLVTLANTKSTFDASFQAGFLIGTDVTGLQNYPNTHGCLAAATITQACHSSFVSQLAGRAFRRSVSAGEASALAAKLWDSSLAKNELLQLTFTSIVSMPDFTYKIYDQGISQGGTVLSLNADELATKLSLFLTGAPPDAALQAKAASGDILKPLVYASEVDRLLALPAARETVKRLFRESYGYDYYDGFSYPGYFANTIGTGGLMDGMNQELDDYFTSIVLDQRGTFNDLMSSTQTKLSNTSLANIYGVASTSTNLGPERAGFLNRAAMLTKRSGVLTSPIKRGLKILEHVLCQQIGLPPPNAPTNLPGLPAGVYVSTRDRTHSLTEVPGSQCAMCHARMDSLGYAFERFDTLGRVRPSEPIWDSNGNVITNVSIYTRANSNELNPPQTATVSDSADLSQQLGSSQRAMMCFAQHLKRFESRLPASNDQNCQMNAALETMYGANGAQGSIADVIKAFVSTPEFREWNFAN